MKRQYNKRTKKQEYIFIIVALILIPAIFAVLVLIIKLFMWLNTL